MDRPSKEIHGPKASIFLDEHNMQAYMDIASKIQKRYGSSKIEELGITGDTYLKRIKQLIDVAHAIMDKTLVPDLFDVIPVKKDGTFQANRKIVIYKNGISEVSTYDYYVSGCQLALCIIPHKVYDYRDRYDTSEIVNETRARLAITSVEGAKKIYPLLDKNLNIQDIKTKTAYLKDSDVRPGCIYEEKSGTEYLYMGRIKINALTPENPTRDYDYDTENCWHHYVRITKKITEIIKDSNSLDEFLEKFAKSKLKRQYDDLPFSIRINPRKFIRESAAPFPEKPWINTNPLKVKSEDVKTMFRLMLKKYDSDEKTEMSYAVFLEQPKEE